MKVIGRNLDDIEDRRRTRLMNLDDNFDWDDPDLYVRPWGESRTRLLLAGLVQALSLAFLWGPIVDTWQLMRSISFSAEIPDDWQF